jgi:hypothetical protein
MTGTESTSIRVGDGVCWANSLTDRGTVESVDWRDVRIAWDDGHKTEVFHNDMRQIERAPNKLV